MYSEASNLAKGVDFTFILVFSVAFFFLIAITGFMIYMIIHFSRKKNKNPRQFTHNTALEITWTVIPLIIVLVIFYVGLIEFNPMRKVPADAMNITAIGRMWQWEFDYGDNHISNDLVVPLNKDIRLNLVSKDVNHSLFIPAFRLKEDVVPGYKNYMWFRPQMKGEFDIFCAEYCGLNHSGMLGKVIVLDSADYNTWYAGLLKNPVVKETPGLALLKKNNCLSCHSLDGSKLVGPSFKGLYGSKVQVTTDQGEKEETADDAYITRSIKDPNAEIAKGYPKGLMQSYTNVLKDEDIKNIIEFLKSAK